MKFAFVHSEKSRKRFQILLTEKNDSTYKEVSFYLLYDANCSLILVSFGASKLQVETIVAPSSPLLEDHDGDSDHVIMPRSSDDDKLMITDRLQFLWHLQ